MTHNLRTGEIVYVFKSWFIRHFGIATGDGRIISNCKRRGHVVVQSIPEFADGKMVFRDGVPDEAFAQQAVRRALSRKHQPYDLFSDNCEHFVSWAYGQSPRSRQLELYLAVGILGCILLAATR